MGLIVSSIILLAFITVVLFLKCKLYISCSVKYGVVIKVGALGLWFRVPKKEKRAKIAGQKAVKDVEKSYISILKRIGELKRKIHLEKAEAYIELGLCDAAVTGIAVGAAWAGIYSLKAFLDKTFILNDFDAKVVPNFLEEKVDAGFEAVFSITVARMVIILIKIFKWR